MRQFTIGYRARFPEIYKEFLGPCMANLVGDFKVLRAETAAATGCDDFSSNKYPAEQYNDLIDACTTPYLVLVHEDLVFTSGFLQCLEDTIVACPNFGAIGLVGADKDSINRWSEVGNIHEVDTLDSCCILIDKRHGIKFNDKVFNEFHLYVEDYCAQAKLLGKQVFTIKLKEGEKVDHCSTTWNKLGAGWGNHSKYRNIFGEMYPDLKTT